MTEEELRREVRAYGWSLLRRKRGEHLYLYSARKQEGRREERYLCPLNQLHNLASNAILVKLSDNGSQRQSRHLLTMADAENKMTNTKQQSRN